MAAFDGLNVFEVRLDLKKTLPMDPIELVAGDTGNRLKISVTDGDSTVSLENCFITAVFSSDGTAVVQDSTDGSMQIEGGTVTVDLRPAVLMPGTVDCELQIYTSTAEEPLTPEDYDVLVTTKRFAFDCRAPLMNDEAIPALPGMPALTALLNEIAAAEQARVEAEQARALEFAALVEAFHGCITGEGEPTSATDGAAGQLYFDTQNAALYVCTATSPSSVWKPLMLPGSLANTLKVWRNATYEFSDIPTEPITLQQLVNIVSRWYAEIGGKQDALTFDSAPTSGSQRPVTSGGVYTALHSGDMTQQLDLVLAQAQSSVTLGGFDCSELMLFITGGMDNGSAARVNVNGDPEYGRFSNFCLGNCDEPDMVGARLTLEKPICGFAIARRILGGDPDGEGFTSSSAEHCTLIPVQGITRYTSLKITCEGQGKFPAGTRFLLMGIA